MRHLRSALLTAIAAAIALVVWPGCGMTEPDEGEVLVRGYIRNAQGIGISGQLDFGDGRTTGSVLSSNPEYQISLPPGTYDVTVTPSSGSGYSPTTRQVVINDPTPTSGNEQTVDFQVTGSAAVTGRVVNSQTGAGVQGAALEFFRQDGAGDQSPAERAELTATTDAAGAWSLQSAPAGYFTLRVRKEGFVDAVIADIELVGGVIDIDPFTLAETPPAGALRVVVTWGDTPRDLDSHLTGPLSGGGRYHLYFGDRAPAGSGATLDRDDTDGEGPETTTFTVSPTTSYYRFSVFNFTDQTDLGVFDIANSPTVVEVYGPTGRLKRYTAQAPRTTGNTWIVFEMGVTNGQVSFSDGGCPTPQPAATVCGGRGYVYANGSGDTTAFRQDGPGKPPMLDISAF